MTMGGGWKHLVGASAVSMVAIWAAPAAAVAQDANYEFDISSQNLANALTQFGRVTERQMVFDGEAARQASASAVRGSYTAEDGLRRMLRGTGFVVHESRSGVLVITRAASASRAAGTRQGMAQDAAEAQAGAGAPRAEPVSEIVVTAQKREESVLEVPVSVGVVNASRLRDSGKLRLSDYFAEVPGLSFAGDPTGGSTSVSIRGLTSGVGFNINPAVGFTIDDVPYGSARADGGSYALPEIDPGDLARIEVLRGPQGTLYGANSLGGLIKYVTVAPSLDGVEGEVNAGLNMVRNGDDPGYRLHGSINVPLSDTIAVRGSAFKRESPGYIENPIRGFDGIGRVDAVGGRLSLLWQPVDTVSLKLSGFYQDIEQDGAIRYARPDSAYHASRGLTGLLGYGQQDDQPDTGLRDTENLGFNGTIDVDLGAVRLTSITGFNRTKFRALNDDDRDFGFITQDSEFFIDPSIPDNSTQHTMDGNHRLNKFSQELRADFSFGEVVDVLLGGFYTSEDYDGVFISRLRDIDSRDVVAIRDIGETTFDYEEFAGFGDIVFHATDRLDFQVGARFGRNKGSYQGVNRGVILDGVPKGPPRVGQLLESEEDISTYLATVKYEFRPNVIAYARFATGYRPGGFNSLNQFDQPYPPYKADTSRNYELGFKGTFIDGMVTIDTSVYRIDWDDIQIQVATPGQEFFPFTENGGRARSEGIEFSAEILPWDGMTLSGWVATGSAELAEDFPETASATGEKGDRLPISTKFSGSIAATQEVPLTSTLNGYLGATLIHVGNRLGNFTAPGFYSGITPPRDVFPSYTTLDLRGGIRSGNWSAELYASNLTDAHGILYGDQDYYVPIKAREVGINLTTRF